VPIITTYADFLECFNQIQPSGVGRLACPISTDVFDGIRSLRWDRKGHRVAPADPAAAFAMKFYHADVDNRRTGGYLNLIHTSLADLDRLPARGDHLLSIGHRERIGLHVGPRNAFRDALRAHARHIQRCPLDDSHGFEQGLQGATHSIQLRAAIGAEPGCNGLLSDFLDRCMRRPQRGPGRLRAVAFQPDQPGAIGDAHWALLHSDRLVTYADGHRVMCHRAFCPDLAVRGPAETPDQAPDASAHCQRCRPHGPECLPCKAGQ
jgi:hypothetical protein